MIVKAGMAITAVIIASMITAGLSSAQISAQRPTQLPANINNFTEGNTTPNVPNATIGNQLPVQTVQDHRFIVTTVTKNGEQPQGPIIVIPPNETSKENGTIVAPGENQTQGGNNNETIIIEPGGNVTEIPNANVTHPDNGTIIITDENRTVTETPGDVVVIDPPANETNQPANGTCTCNQNGNVSQTPIPPVIIAPAPGQNITQVPPPRIDNSLPAQQPGGNTNNTSNESGLHPSQLPVFPPSGNESNTPAGNTTSGDQSQSDNTPKVNPLMPSTFTNNNSKR